MNKQASLMLIVQDDRVLSVSRKNDPTKFALIGGKLHSQETFEQAAIRECQEETDIIVSACEYLYSCVDEEGYECVCFLATQWTGIPFAVEEGTQVKWLVWEDIIGDNKGAYPKYNKEVMIAYRKITGYETI